MTGTTKTVTTERTAFPLLKLVDSLRSLIGVLWSQCQYKLCRGLCQGGPERGKHQEVGTKCEWVGVVANSIQVQSKRLAKVDI